jgi:cell division cycle 20, cofactor of APC complex
MSQFDVTEFESMMSLDRPLNSSTATRWERRAARQQQLSSSQGQGSTQPSQQQSQQSQQQQPSQSDRYIPNRSGMDFDLMMNMSTDENGGTDGNTSMTSEHAKLLLANTLGESTDGGGGKSSSRVLAYKNKAPAPADGYQSSLKVLYSGAQSAKKEVVKTSRHISSAPVRVLDAPDMLDDYCESNPIRLFFIKATH